MMLHSVEKDPALDGAMKLRPALVKRSSASVFAALLASVVAPGAWGPANAELITDYPFRDSFARQYQTERSPRIEIKEGISGPVTISSGRTRTVDIAVQRTAATQWELDCHAVKIDHRGDRITITQVQFSDRRECHTIRASQTLTLQVPSDTILRVSAIAGDLQVTGPVRSVTADSIAGHVNITAAGIVDLNSLARGLSLHLGGDSPGSVTIESVIGPVELDVTQRRNVEIRVTSLEGEISALPPGFIRLKTDDGYLIKRGKGGPFLSINSVHGDVVVRSQ
jgi:hypothetical protein